MKIFKAALAAALFLTCSVSFAQSCLVLGATPKTIAGSPICIGGSSVPPQAQAVGYNSKTFDSTTLTTYNATCTAGQVCYPAKFNSYSSPSGSGVQNGDGSFTISQGANNPQVATARFNSGKTNSWEGECFGQGGYFEQTAYWTNYAYDGNAWASFGLYDVVLTANGVLTTTNNEWKQAITASAVTSTSATIPAWAGTITLTGQVTFPDAETRVVTFTPGATSITWTTGLTSTPSAPAALNVIWQHTITASSGITSGSTSAVIPTWNGTSATGTVTFSDGETRSIAFTNGSTSISWTGGLSATPPSSILSITFGGSKNYGNWPELDIEESDTPIGQVAVDAFINWYDTFGSGPSKVHTSFSPISANTAVAHKYGLLWVPAIGGTQGYAKWYFDNKLINTATWNQYSVNTPPIPTGSGTSNTWTGGNAFSVMDSRCMMMVWNTASGTHSPMTVTSAKVWQATSANNVTQ